MGSHPPPTPAVDPAPERLGRYRLVRPISAGGMARVFEGRRESLAGVSPRVAIKVILPDFATDTSFQQLFVNEARIGSQLQHQNLVGIQDFDREGDLYYLVMEFVAGITLRRTIGLCRKHGLSIPASIVAEVGRQVCEGLHYLHLAQAEDGTPLHLVHRDMKPSNLMLNAQGLVKVLDFGISKALFSRERKGAVRGTWGYMSPEQATGGEVGPLADVFGLAAVICELCTLAPLFPEKESREIRKLLADDEAARRAAALSGPHGALAPLLIRALQRDPAARFPSAMAFGKALSERVNDPTIARDQLVKFHQTLMDLQGAVPGSPGARSGATLSRGGSTGSSLDSGHRSHGSRGSGAALPLAVGSAPVALDADLPRTQALVSHRRRTRKRRLRWVLGVAVALGILVFAGYRVVDSPRSAPPEARRPPPSTPLSTMLESVGKASPPKAEPSGTATSPTAGAAKQAPSGSGSGTAGSEPAASTPPPSNASASGGAVSSSGGASAPESTASGSASSGAAGSEVSEASPEAVSSGSGDGSAPAGEPAGDDGPLVETEQGLLTISSVPRAQVILDGQFLRWVPVFKHGTVPGSHTITLVTEDGRRHTFRVSVEADEEVRRVWHFERGEWAE